ncbi:HtaA domain-containing protein [Microbacterium sp. SS28]|uniref:HtaA domain-containing protein n=1 Tax=Microbacterium sp. SS28 TaxID=2919948 RepID=UPI001FAAAB01|nr:HtaA domain-containing protein [Microbacterium sp. SS28]
MQTAIEAESCLRWAVRESLLRYVTVIAGGTCTVDGDAVKGDDGIFTFPLRAAVQEGEDWRLSFGGSVRLEAHHGLMDVLIKDPELVVGPGRGVLATHTPDGELLALVALDEAAPTDDGDALVWAEVPTQLASAAVDLFGTAYPAGTGMAPIAIRVSH